MKKELILRTRREFLRSTIWGGALAGTVPSFLAQTFSALDLAAAGQAQPVTGKEGPILVVLQMAGGNDGLNTIVPFTNDFYHRARPRIGLPASAVLKASEGGDFGFHPALSGLKSLFDAGQLAVVNGVGYPNPNRSHFRSTEIWQTASDSEKFERHGWIGRYFDHACAGADPTVGVNIGRQMPQAFAAAKPKGVSLENPERYRFASLDEDGMEEKSFRKMTADSAGAGESIGSVAGAPAFKGSALDFLERTAMDAQVSSDRILQVSRGASNKASYPASQLASSLKLVGRLIAGGLPTRIYYVSQGGYDTHTNQANAHDRLLRELGDGLQAFVADLKAQGNLSRVLIMTFSEFGRRVAENANQGTDHGAAAPLFLAGGGVKPGFLGKFPSLAPSDLVNGDPRYAVDFRSVYAAVLENWLKTPSEPVLGRKFLPLDCVKGS